MLAWKSSLNLVSKNLLFSQTIIFAFAMELGSTWALNKISMKQNIDLETIIGFHTQEVFCDLMQKDCFSRFQKCFGWKLMRTSVGKGGKQKQCNATVILTHCTHTTSIMLSVINTNFHLCRWVFPPWSTHINTWIHLLVFTSVKQQTPSLEMGWRGCSPFIYTHTHKERHTHTFILALLTL